MGPNTFCFSDALRILTGGNPVSDEWRNRGKVARQGWHGKGMYIELQDPTPESKMTLPYIYMVIPRQKEDEDGMISPSLNLVPWLASQTDLLAEDWYEVA